MPNEDVKQGLASELVLDIVQDNKQGYYISNWAQGGTTLSHLSAEGVWQHYNFNIVGSNPFDKLLCLAYDKERGVLYGGHSFQELCTSMGCSLYRLQRSIRRLSAN